MTRTINRTQETTDITLLMFNCYSSNFDTQGLLKLNYSFFFGGEGSIKQTFLKVHKGLMNLKTEPLLLMFLITRFTNCNLHIIFFIAIGNYVFSWWLIVRIKVKSPNQLKDEAVLLPTYISLTYISNCGSKNNIHFSHFFFTRLSVTVEMLLINNNIVA